MAFKVLLVDESSRIRSVIKLKLKEVEQLPLSQLWEATSGKEAIELMAEHQIDLVLADINMPEMTGTEMAERMEADKRLRLILY